MSDTKKTLQTLAKGAGRLAHHMERYRLRGIGKGCSFSNGKPVCALGHIIDRAGLAPLVTKKRESVCSNESALRYLGVDLTRYGRPIRDTLCDLTEENDSDDRTYKRMLLLVKKFERELRTKANEM